MTTAAAALLTATLLALWTSPVVAGGAKVVISAGHFGAGHAHGGGHFGRHSAVHPHQGPHVFPHRFQHGYTSLIVVPRTVYAPYGRWGPGYWIYQWVPQVHTSYVWVPGHYASNGYWVEGHYAPQTTQTGYYQPVWVSGY